MQGKNKNTQTSVDKLLTFKKKNILLEKAYNSKKFRQKYVPQFKITMK